MADYYPLLARALEALPNSSPALRKAVYDRARNALTAQLRSLDPPVSESDIAVEQRALDTAIKRLEITFGADAGPQPASEAKAASVPAAPDLPRPAAEPTEAPAANVGPEASAARPAAVEPPKPAPMPPAVALGPLSATPRSIFPQPNEARAGNAPPSELATDPVPVQAIEPAPEPLPDLKPEPKRAEFVAFVPPPRRKPAAPSDSSADQTAPRQAGAPDVSASAPPSLSTIVVPSDAGASRRPKIDVVAPKANRSRALRNVFVGSVLGLVIAGIAVTAFLLRDEPSSLALHADDGDPAQTEQPEQKFGDRVDGPGEEGRKLGGAASPPEVTVAQRGILYEENQSNPQAEPRTSTGRVVWRLEPVNGLQGQPLQNVVRTTADFPEAGVLLTMTLRKNLDETLPASHTIELEFTMSGPAASQVVQDIGLPQLKEDQNSRGSTVSGLPVRVRDNFFLIGLSNLPSDIDRNKELLIQRAWIDLGFKFRSGQRGAIAIEKGASGTRTLQAAFDLWRS